MMGILKGGNTLKNIGTAVILCGGKSSRMGIDKSRIKVKGKPIIKIIAEELEKVFDEIILVTNDKNRFEDLSYKSVEDLQKNCGPAGGIYTGLKNASSSYAFITACDMPFINIEFIRYLISLADSYSPDCIIPRKGKWIEPLCAFYSRSLIEIFGKSIASNNFKLHEIVKNSNVYYVEEEVRKKYSENLDIFTNLNYLKDLDILRKVYGGEVSLDE